MKFENEPLGNFEMSPEKRMFFIFYYWYLKKKNWFEKNNNVMTSIYLHNIYFHIWPIKFDDIEMKKYWNDFNL